jgi:hypothetical protein
MLQLHVLLEFETEFRLDFTALLTSSVQTRHREQNRRFGLSKYVGFAPASLFACDPGLRIQTKKMIGEQSQ